MRQRGLHVACGTEPFEGVFRLVVHGAAAAFGDSGSFKLGDDLFYRGGFAVDRIGDVLIAKRAVALAVFREIQIDDRNILALDVPPDIKLGPMQDRMDADVCAGREVGLELVPEFRRLVAEIPFGVLATRTEDTFLGAGRFLVPADTGNHGLHVLLGDQAFQRFGLARC